MYKTSFANTEVTTQKFNERWEKSIIEYILCQVFVWQKYGFIAI